MAGEHDQIFRAALMEGLLVDNYATNIWFVLSTNVLGMTDHAILCRPAVHHRTGTELAKTAESPRNTRGLSRFQLSMLPTPDH